MLCVANGTISITASGYEVEDEGWYWVSEPAVITLTFSGTVAGEPGTVITNEACSERTTRSYRDGPMALSMGDPTVPGGGVICDSASVTIIGDDPSPSPSPTPTETPTTPSVVTGLPETGHGGAGTASVLWFAAVASVRLLAAGAGIRIRPRS